MKQYVRSGKGGFVFWIEVLMDDDDGFTKNFLNKQ